MHLRITRRHLHGEHPVPGLLKGKPPLSAQRHGAHPPRRDRISRDTSRLPSSSKGKHPTRSEEKRVGTGQHAVPAPPTSSKTHLPAHSAELRQTESQLPGSNRVPARYEGAALPGELSWRAGPSVPENVGPSSLPVSRVAPDPAVAAVDSNRAFPYPCAGRVRVSWLHYFASAPTA